MKKILIGSILTLLFVFLYTQEDLRPYKLINADQLVVEKINDEYITYLNGNVHFFYGSTECYTDSAEVFEKQKITRMMGNVEVYDDTLSLYSDDAEYYRMQEEFYLTGDVLFRVDHSDSTFRTFKGDRINYYRNSREVEAFDNVSAYDSKEELTGTCEILKYNIEKGYGYLMQNPVIAINKQDSLRLSAEKFEYYNDFQKIVANFNVNTKSNEFEISSSFLIYFSEENKATYLGYPIFKSEFAEATAKEFRIYFTDNNKISSAELQDSCVVYFSTEKEKKRTNWVSSELMFFTFEKGKISECNAEGNVSSYYQQDKTKKENFYANSVTGKRMHIKINNNEIEAINMYEGISGSIKFERE